MARLLNYKEVTARGITDHERSTRRGIPTQKNGEVTFMKTTRNRLLGKTVLALSLLGSAAGVASAQPSISAGIHLGSSGRASVDLGFFYDNLASYGNWIQRPSYGWVWTPSQVSSNWRPYQDGHWVWTDQGWTWISEEPYGWATYHYGRWYDDPEIGWEWVPGTDWAPAWVSFQEGADYVGWAPLPPSYDINVGYNGGYGLSPEAYVFVPERFFLSASLGSYFVPRDRVSVFFGRTRNYTSYRHDGGRIYNQGIPFENVQRFVGRNVPRYQIADLQGGYQQRGGARIAGNRLEDLPAAGAERPRGAALLSSDRPPGRGERRAVPVQPPEPRGPSDAGARASGAVQPAAVPERLSERPSAAVQRSAAGSVPI